MGSNANLAIVRGGGDLATGIIYRLWSTGFKVLSLEVEKPMAVRRTVAVASAIFDENFWIEDMPVKRIYNLDELNMTNDVCVIVDPKGESISNLSPHIVVDCIMAKYNTGTVIEMAPLVIGIGPGFQAKTDVDYVVETKRGHTLGRLISEGSAIPNTGIPGMEMGYTSERLLRSPVDGYLNPLLKIGDHVEAGDFVAIIDGCPVRAQIKGTLRGLIHPSVFLTKGMKIGDIDPRDVFEHCFSITDKALAVGGAVLEAVLKHNRK